MLVLGATAGASLPPLPGLAGCDRPLCCWELTHSNNSGSSSVSALLLMLVGVRVRCWMAVGVLTRCWAAAAVRARCWVVAGACSHCRMAAGQHALPRLASVGCCWPVSQLLARCATPWGVNRWDPLACCTLVACGMEGSWAHVNMNGCGGWVMGSGQVGRMRLQRVVGHA